MIVKTKKDRNIKITICNPGQKGVKRNSFHKIIVDNKVYIETQENGQVKIYCKTNLVLFAILK